MCRSRAWVDQVAESVQRQQPEQRSRRRGGAKRDMCRGAPFGEVDLVSAEHRLDAVAQTARVCQVEQQVQRLIGNPML
jgi:hypothetical protein